MDFFGYQRGPEHVSINFKVKSSKYRLYQDFSKQEEEFGSTKWSKIEFTLSSENFSEQNKLFGPFFLSLWTNGLDEYFYICQFNNQSVLLKNVFPENFKSVEELCDMVDLEFVFNPCFFEKDFHPAKIGHNSKQKIIAAFLLCNYAETALSFDGLPIKKTLNFDYMLFETELAKKMFRQSNDNYYYFQHLVFYSIKERLECNFVPLDNLKREITEGSLLQFPVDSIKKKKKPTESNLPIKKSKISSNWNSNTLNGNTYIPGGSILKSPHSNYGFDDTDIQKALEASLREHDQDIRRQIEKVQLSDIDTKSLARNWMPPKNKVLSFIYTQPESTFFKLSSVANENLKKVNTYKNINRFDYYLKIFLISEDKDIYERDHLRYYSHLLFDYASKNHTEKSSLLNVITLLIARITKNRWDPLIYVDIIQKILLENKDNQKIIDAIFELCISRIVKTSSELKTLRKLDNQNFEVSEYTCKDVIYLFFSKLNKSFEDNFILYEKLLFFLALENFTVRIWLDIFSYMFNCTGLVGNVEFDNFLTRLPFFQQGSLYTSLLWYDDNEDFLAKNEMLKYISKRPREITEKSIFTKLELTKVQDAENESMYGTSITEPDLMDDVVDL
jgi:hypothetical protein